MTRSIKRGYPWPPCGRKHCMGKWRRVQFQWVSDDLAFALACHAIRGPDMGPPDVVLPWPKLPPPDPDDKPYMWRIDL